MGELGGEARPVVVQPEPTILSLEAWDFNGVKGEIIRTKHYRIYSTESNQAMRRRLAGFMEYALANYRTSLGALPPPPVRLDTYLMDNRQQWERVTKQLMGSQSDQLLSIQRGGYASRGIGVYFDLGLFDTCAIAAHEGWHQYTQRTFRDPLPTWLEEGIATYMEGHTWSNATPVFRGWANIERFDQLRKAVNKDKLIPLVDLLHTRPQDYVERVDDSLLVYYAQLWALVHFLNEGEQAQYAGSLRRLVQDALEGNIRSRMTAAVGSREANAAIASRTGTAAFEAYFGTDLDGAAKSYEQFVRNIVRPGGRQSVVAGRSPISASNESTGRSDTDNSKSR